jgi:hypothetical protein
LIGILSSDVKRQEKDDKTEGNVILLLPLIWFSFVLDMDAIYTLLFIDFLNAFSRLIIVTKYNDVTKHKYI